jgi:hypothetical protein
MKNKKNVIIAATLSLATLLAPLEAFAAKSKSQETVNTISVSNEAVNSLQVVSPNAKIESVEVTILSPEESLALQSKLTGKSIQELKDEQAKSARISIAAANPTYDANYSIVADLGGGVKVQAGILAQIEQISFGGSFGRQFIKVYATGFLSPYSGGTFTVSKNYVQGTLQDAHHLQLSFSGYAETAVTTSGTSGVDELIQFGWSASSTVQGTQYYRKQFLGSNTFVQN